MARQRLLVEGLRPTAILANNDLAALAVICAVKQTGLTVPVDLPVAGYGNIEISAVYNPPLTTVSLTHLNYGERAVQMLPDQIEHPEKPPTTVRFEGEGTGLASNVNLRINPSGTLAVGVSNPADGSRVGAQTLAIDSQIIFDTDSLLELGLFGDGDNDQLDFIANGGPQGTTTLKLVLHNGYESPVGNSWTLFTGPGPWMRAWATST